MHNQGWLWQGEAWDPSFPCRCSQRGFQVCVRGAPVFAACSELGCELPRLQPHALVGPVQQPLVETWLTSKAWCCHQLKVYPSAKWVLHCDIIQLRSETGSSLLIKKIPVLSDFPNDKFSVCLMISLLLFFPIWIGLNYATWIGCI